MSVELLDVRSVAKLVRLSSRQIYNLIFMGKFPPGFRLGRSRRWRVEDVDRYLADLAGEQVPAGGEG